MFLYRTRSFVSIFKTKLLFKMCPPFFPYSTIQWLNLLFRAYNSLSASGFQDIKDVFEFQCVVFLKRSQLYAPIVRFMFSEFQSVVYKMFSTVCVSQCSVLYSQTLFRRHNTFMFSCLSLFFLFLYIHWVRVRIDAKALSKKCLNRWYSVMSGLWVLFYTSNIRVNLKWELG